MEEARAVTAQILQLKPDFAIRQLRIKGWNPEQAEHLRVGMRKAGLPE
jgi:hypothetical protein